MRTSSLVHNRRMFALALAVATLALVGFSCGSKQTASRGSGGPDAGAAVRTDGGVAADAGADAGSQLPTRWTTYRSEALGVAIPYPEGWYVEEDSTDGATSFYTTQPPNDSDMAPRVWIDRHDGSADEFVVKLDNIQSDEFVRRSGIRMRKIVRRDDLSDDEGLAVSYIWEVDSKTYRIGGRQGDPILESVMDQVEVLP